MSPFFERWEVKWLAKQGETLKKQFSHTGVFVYHEVIAARRAAVAMQSSLNIVELGCLDVDYLPPPCLLARNRIVHSLPTVARGNVNV